MADRIFTSREDTVIKPSNNKNSERRKHNESIRYYWIHINHKLFFSISLNKKTFYLMTMRLLIIIIRIKGFSPLWVPCFHKIVKWYFTLHNQSNKNQYLSSWCYLRPKIIIDNVTSDNLNYHNKLNIKNIRKRVS